MDMNTKGATWVGKAEIRRISLHTIEFTSRTAHSVFFTLGEEGNLELKAEGDADHAFMFLHAPDSYIVFRKDRTITSFNGLRLEMETGPGSYLKAEKSGKDIIFTSDNGYMLRTSLDAFSGSASIGLTTEGEGNMRLEVF